MKNKDFKDYTIGEVINICLEHLEQGGCDGCPFLRHDKRFGITYGIICDKEDGHYPLAWGEWIDNEE